MKKDGTSTGKAGFTIVELLTVMAVIAVLIGLLVPALNLVREFANEIQQKGQFHSIGIGLEMFKTEYGFYPPSNDNADPFHLHPQDIVPYGGAQKMAEALVGLDLLGFHPRSDFRTHGTFSHDDGTGTGTMKPDAWAYHPGADYLPANTLFEETALENVQARKGPFVELENANAYTMEDVYGSLVAAPFARTPGNLSDPLLPLTPFVVCDEYAKKRELGKKTGMPILYYRAHTNSIFQDSLNDNELIPIGSLTDEDIFDYRDNRELIELGSATQPAEIHPIDIILGTDPLAFESVILNPQVTTIDRPFRAGSYILMSAGKDGLYGNADDIYNFDNE
ncbi:MAG: type II secretion system protein [Planctomycetes bacterium]|nr:type II secretion system protein [Planctomycetota bacterium]